uniref:Uncharacterized protein n=1 Tax=Neobodo designis TaxID=312471 RepID=A0A7S1Q0B7_NEODS
MRALILLAVAAALVAAQDPPPGWTAYATGNCPAGTRLTKMEATWKVLGNAPASQAFYSPWFGSDTTDNLNLLQPVNPWFGNSWNFYTEYFQWSPTHNVDSTSYPTSTGNTLHGEIIFNGVNEQSYTVRQTDQTQGQSSQMTIPVQRDVWGNYKNYTVLYVVFEKIAQCNEYPPDEIVTFKDINVYCDGELITPQWTTAVVDEVCDFTAHVINPHEISITWNTQSSKRPAKHLIEQSQSDRTFGRRFPKRV